MPYNISTQIFAKLIKFEKHQDTYEKGFTSAIFYLNTNNGYTKIENKKKKRGEMGSWEKQFFLYGDKKIAGVAQW